MSENVKDDPAAGKQTPMRCWLVERERGAPYYMLTREDLADAFAQAKNESLPVWSGVGCRAEENADPDVNVATIDWDTVTGVFEVHGPRGPIGAGSARKPRLDEREQ